MKNKCTPDAHKMRLNKTPYEKIRSGEKTVELRLYDEKRQLIKVGDLIEFECREAGCSPLIARVKALYRYPSFKELFDSVDLAKCGYSESERTTSSYRDMEQYYSAEEIVKFGALGIEIELC